MNFIGFIIVGMLAGWLGSKIMKGKGMGIGLNLLLGVGGAILGGWSFRLIGLDFNGFIGSLFTATIGAIVILFIAQKMSNK